jgi:hypothetical protein
MIKSISFYTAVIAIIVCNIALLGAFIAVHTGSTILGVLAGAIDGAVFAKLFWTAYLEQKDLDEYYASLK